MCRFLICVGLLGSDVIRLTQEGLQRGAQRVLRKVPILLRESPQSNYDVAARPRELRFRGTISKKTVTHATNKRKSAVIVKEIAAQKPIRDHIVFTPGVRCL